MKIIGYNKLTYQKKKIGNHIIDIHLVGEISTNDGEARYRLENIFNPYTVPDQTVTEQLYYINTIVSNSNTEEAVEGYQSILFHYRNGWVLTTVRHSYNKVNTVYTQDISNDIVKDADTFVKIYFNHIIKFHNMD